RKGCTLTPNLQSAGAKRASQKLLRINIEPWSMLSGADEGADHPRCNIWWTRESHILPASFPTTPIPQPNYPHSAIASLRPVGPGRGNPVDFAVRSQLHQTPHGGPLATHQGKVRITDECIAPKLDRLTAGWDRFQLR